MLYLFPTWSADVDFPRWYGFLDAPKRKNKAPFEEGYLWGMDNGCFTGVFTPEAFIDNLLWRQEYRGTNLFVAAPDVVGDHTATYRQWPYWSELIRDHGFRPAFVLQDGCDKPPQDAEALFLGGTTGYKLGDGMALLSEHRERYTHVGRVNTLRRIRRCKDAGVDSVDGTRVTFGGFGDTMAALDQILSPTPLFGARP